METRATPREAGSGFLDPDRTRARTRSAVRQNSRPERTHSLQYDERRVGSCTVKIGPGDVLLLPAIAPRNACSLPLPGGLHNQAPGRSPRHGWRFRFFSVSQVRAMDRTAQLRGKYQSACKSHGSTCICRGTRQDPCARRGCRPNCTGSAAVYTWSPPEPWQVMPRRRPRQKYRKPTGVISFVVPPPIAGLSSRTPPPNATADDERLTVCRAET
jgi:hypothetical protein